MKNVQAIFDYLDTLNLNREEKDFIAGCDHQVIKDLFSVDMPIEEVKETINAYSDSDYIFESDVDTVDLWDLDMSVEVVADKVTEYSTDDLFYKQSYELEDGRIIAYDHTIDSWVMLG